MKEFHCSECSHRYEVDLDKAQFSTQLSMFNGKKFENRMYFSKCPNCQHVNSFESDKKEDWGNQKSPNIAKFKFLIGGSCLLTIVIGALVAYFAGQGIITIMDWLTNR